MYVCVCERERERERKRKLEAACICSRLSCALQRQREGASEGARKGGREREKKILSHLAFFLSTFSCLALYKDRGSVEERVGERVRGRHAGRESFSE